MNFKFTNIPGFTLPRKFFIFLVLIASAFEGYSQVNLINEGFDVAVPLPGGWSAQNNSNPVGTTGWGQGLPAVFPSNSGAPNSYIFANFQNTANVGVISNWLISPQIALTNGDILKFYTSGTGSNFPDNLEVRLSTNGASTNVGTGSSDVGDFTTLLLEINPTLSVGIYPDVWTQYTINITGLSAGASGRIAFRYFIATDAGPLGNNSDYIGIDDVLYTSFPPNCTGTPAPGNTISSVTNICPGLPFNLSVQNNTSGSGVTYQWQSSPDGTTFTNITGANLPVLNNTSQVSSTYYQLVVTCASNSANSTPVLVPMAPATSCYCNSGATNTADEDIFNVSIGSLNNSSDCSTLAPGALSVQNRYSNYTNGPGIPAPGQIVSGGTNPFSVRIGTCGGNFTNSVAAWIDFNQDGAFTANEKIYVSPSGTVGPHTETTNVTVPSTALNGITRMRVVNVETGTPGNILPCGTYAWGETEDYLVTISPCVPASLTSSPINASVVCGGNTSFSVGVSGSFPAYQWEQRISPTSPWTLVSNNAIFSGATSSTLTITEATSTMNGYQYRAIFSGSCTALDASAVATLTVTPLVATTNVSSATICNGSSQLLAITNTASAPNTLSISSGPLSLNIPDDTDAGVSTDLTVAGVPAGATITNVSVKFSLTHTYCGDMLLNLKAPNGNILALDKYLTGTGNQAGPYPNTGFVNTIISSSGTTALGTVNAQPITGTFRADALNTLPAGFVVLNPAGFVSNATGFADLYSTPNGVWTLALADGGPADFGVLTAWSIDITYVAPTLASGTWSPVTGLFLDAGLTIPYTGTLEDSVYAAPTSNTDYSVTVQTAICNSSPLTIPVTVATPVGGTITNPTNAVGCTQGIVNFTGDAQTGGPFEYQWEESTDGGATYSPVSDGGVYSGSQTNTLTLTNPAASMGGNRYRLLISVPSCGSSVTTAFASLTVNANPDVTITAAPYTSLYPGLRTTLTANPAGLASYQWYLDGTAITGATSFTYIADIDGLGVYSVEGFDASQCGGASSNSITITDSLNTSLFITPNPSTGQIQVRFNDKFKGVTKTRNVTIYDSKGARVYNQAFINVTGFNKMQVDLTGHPAGVYYIDVVDAAGRRLQTGSFVIF
jgi:subtilisin-like proprotein convertase family protein